jgi:outer membrane protein OmpA-like peptidoglycan-associated protein
MRRYVLVFDLAALIVVLSVSGAAAASAHDCDRAEAIRKHVRSAETMPREIKQELLSKASRLCPEKGASSPAARRSKDLIERDIIVESLRGHRSVGHRRYNREEDAPRVVFHSILFESGSATLTPSSRDQLDELGSALNSPRLAHVRTFFIDGHTDSIGTQERNCELGYRRAKSVINYLVQEWDIRPSRLVPQSFGQYVPIGSNSTSLGRLLNRRVEVRNGDAVEWDDRYRRERCR